MNGAASNAVPLKVRFAPMRAGLGSPQWLTMTSRGQGHAFCARRPRLGSHGVPPRGTRQGSNLSESHLSNQCLTFVTVIFRVHLVCAEVHDLVLRPAQQFRQLLFQRKPPVVRGNSHAHHNFSMIRGSNLRAVQRVIAGDMGVRYLFVV